MVAAAILKTQKVTISRNGLTDFDEIWHVDASRPSIGLCQPASHYSANEIYYNTNL